MELFWYLLALIVPCLTVIVFTMITKNKYVAIILTFIIFGVSIYREFYHSEWVIFIDALSIVIGYLIVEIYELDRNTKE